ncbi:MAG: tetratricopeptide repeat protein, partial [Salibacteraceae bacterium]|nr:tetratricopeptide repeat protein [Salibacteraceae bacterium]
IALSMLIIHLKNETSQKAAVGAIVVIFGFLTINRAADWKSNFILFTGDVAKIEQSARAHYNAATAYNDQAGIEPRKAVEYRKEAVKHHKRAIEIWPEYKDAYNNLSIVYLGLGQYDEAIKLLQTMLEKYPEYTKAYYNLAIAALKSENYALTESAGEAYLNRTQNNELLFIVAEAEGFLGKFDEAKAHLETLIKLEPGNSRGFLKLGMANAMTNNPEVGLYYLQEGLAIDNQNTEILFNIALIYLNTSNVNEAIRFLNQVLVIEPNNQKALSIKNQLII